MSNRHLPLTEEQRIALGFRPQSAAGWWQWLRYWSPLAHWGRVVCCTQCRRCWQVHWRFERHRCNGWAA